MKKLSIKPFLCLLFSVLIFTSSCSSVWSKKYKDDAGVMYGMIYDGNEEGVSGVNVKVNGWLKAVSDGQGRFILKFLYADIAELGWKGVSRTLEHEEADLEGLFFRIRK